MEASKEPEPGTICSGQLIVVLYIIHSASTGFYSIQKNKQAVLLRLEKHMKYPEIITDFLPQGS